MAQLHAHYAGIELEYGRTMGYNKIEIVRGIQRPSLPQPTGIPATLLLDARGLLRHEYIIASITRPAIVYQRVRFREKIETLLAWHGER